MYKMDLMSSTPSPAHAQILRRRKKRLTPTNGAPGSSLSGLNRSSIRVVELIRGSSGYGFTISGQKPCLLRCIVEGSPAEFTGLQPGNCLVSVNGKDVSHLAHDDVVRLIGSCTGLLRLHVADSYFSESSDDESLKGNHTRPRYPHRPKPPSKSSLGIKKLSSTEVKLVEYDLHENIGLPQPIRATSRNQDAILCRMGNANSRRATWDPIMPTPKRGPRPPLPLRDASKSSVNSYPKLERSKGSSSLPSPHGSYGVESVRVFEYGTSHDVDFKPVKRPGDNISSSNFPTNVGKASSNESSDKFNTQNSCNGGHSVNVRKVNLHSKEKSVENVSATFHVVGYVGSVELCKIDDDKRLEALSACIRRLRMEKRVRSVVLLRIQPNGISLFNSSQNVQTGPPLAFYSYNIISFCGACSDDRRFFGLVTCTHPSKNCSCHVFMVEPKLLPHSEHSKRARAFGIQCNSLQVPKTGQVLGLQECTEFPATADPILNSIVQLRQSNSADESSPISQHYAPSSSMRSPSEASTRLETNSSNSDSGIGFRDDYDRLSARIYDIIEPSVLYEARPIRASPVPKKRLPLSYKKQPENPSAPGCSSSMLQLKKQPASLSRVDETTAKPLITNSQDQVKYFECDPNSLKEILGIDKEKPQQLVKPTVKPRRLLRDSNRDRLSLNPPPQRPPRPIEVSVLVTPPRPRIKCEKRQRPSMELMTRISPNKLKNNDSPISQHRVSLTRNGTRSLDNLCSPEILSEPCNNGLELKGMIGSSTPALCQKSIKSQRTDEVVEFKVPQVPKQKVMVDRVEKWGESIEKLLCDSTGLDIFTDFLEHEFSAENIHFYTSCLHFKESFKDLTQSQRISMCSTIFQRYLQNGASDPINVDFQARCHVEKSLSQPSAEMFDLPLAQVFSLLKFDCYPRFLRSEMYRDYSSGLNTLPQSSGEPSDSDQESSKSHQLHQNSRRRSLLPWNIKNRSKAKSRNKNDIDGLNSDISFIQRTVQNQYTESSDQEEDFRRQSYKFCRVTLPDNSTTVLSSKPGESLSTVVHRLLEKREFPYSAFEVVSVATGKAVDLNVDVSEMTTREIRVEPRAFIGIELPQGWKVGLRANPCRKVAEVLKSILAQHSLKLDSVLVYNIETDELVDLKWPVGKLDGHNLHVRSKHETKLDEITNQIQDSYEIMEDDQMSVKTSSSQTSSVFKEFLRRSSKKYKRAKGKPLPLNYAYNMEDGARSDDIGSSTGHPQEAHAIMSDKISDEENSNPKPSRSDLPSTPTNNILTSPLSLIPTELNLVENSRNRKPIYISQATESAKR